ncbi:MAG: hypothetical protein IJP66_09070 [Kiritimatiellae bacterium]|nr:hypothetical protein [Kiritimatiellia bacterium]
MTPTAILLIVASAALHATWNMIVKKSRTGLAMYATLCSVGAIWTFAVRFFTPLNFFSQPAAFYGWQALMLLSEFSYAYGLIASYRALDMSVAYPIMRSLPILLLAGVTTALGIGKPLSAHAVLGMGMAFTGCLFLPLSKFSDFRPSRYLDKSFAYVIFVALGTTGYTLCDSQSQKVMVEAANAAGIEVSKTLFSLTYYSFRSLLLASTLWVVILCGRESRADAVALWRRRSWTPLLAGCCSSMTYILVLIAMHSVTNVAYVQTFRQTGLLFGLAEAVFILKERCTAPKVIGTALVLGGLAISVL